MARRDDVLVWIRPSDVYFTHSKIRPRFSCGRLVVDTLQELRDGKLQAADLPTITVLQEGAALFSLNNRRLWLFKQCEAEGLLVDGKVQARVQPQRDCKRLAQKYTEAKCSRTAKFMAEGPKARPPGPNAPPGGSESSGDEAITMNPPAEVEASSAKETVPAKPFVDKAAKSRRGPRRSRKEANAMDNEDNEDVTLESNLAALRRNGQ
eukprot:EG_transcript_20913